AFGVARAAEEVPPRTLTHHHRLAATVADVLGLHRSGNRVALLVEVERLTAGGIARAGQPLASLVLPQQERLADLGAAMLGLHRRRAGLAIHGAGRLALGVPRAAEEPAALAVLLDHRRAAGLAGFRRGDLHPLHLGLRQLQGLLERVVEL